MKQLKTIALALLFGAIFSVTAFADGNPQGGPGNGNPGNGGPGKGTHYGLSDSCWNIFVSGLSASDAAKLAADQATLTTDQPQIDALNKQINDLLKASTGRKDTATWSKVRDLETQIEVLNKANGAAQMDIDHILRNNNKSFETIAENCGRTINPRDTGKGGPRDTTKGNPTGGGHDNGGRGHFGLSDSCWNIFISQISASDTTQLSADQKIIAANQIQVEALIKQLRALRGSKDSTVRTQIKALMGQIQTLEQSSGAALKDYASIIKKYAAILQGIRNDCGRSGHHRGNAGGPANGLTVTDITPNPANAGGEASVTITLTADAPVLISIASATAMGAPAKIIFNNTLTAGSHVESLNLTGFAAGMYLVNIQSANQSVTKKLVIQ